MSEYDQIWNRAAQIKLARETFVQTVEVAEEVGSTNDWAKERLRATPPDGLAGALPGLYLAARQTAGRGRGSNRWWSGPRSLAFTVVFDPAAFDLDLRQGPPLSLSAGLAVVDAVRRFGPELPVGLHWPNDVFVGNRKLAGILTEVTSGGHVVLGIGLNVNCSVSEAPAEIQHRLTTLQDLLGAPQDVVEVLCELLRRLDHRLRELSTDPEAAGAAFHDACLQRGDYLQVDQPDGAIEGVCLGVDPSGALLLSTEYGPRRILSGALRHRARTSDQS